MTLMTGSGDGGERGQEIFDCLVSFPVGWSRPREAISSTKEGRIVIVKEM